ncbi:MAG: fumarate hydratase [Oscillospiraceae bacterium]|jgi:fumarate hydratase subunit alpha|nr:fumarate hydratase [Oscillospiraceae bacterium]
MREVNVNIITQAVKDLCIKANKTLPEDLANCILNCAKTETTDIAKKVMRDITDNLDAAAELGIPICQDTGMAVIFAEVGQDVHLVGGSFEDALNNGVSQGYTLGYLRCSIVRDPLNRVNTGDNTPAVIHTKIVQGDKIRITVSPKGFGSENMSAIKMFTPSANKDDIAEFIIRTVKDAGSNPCPPMVLGIGIGGDFELCAYLSKKALCRPVAQRNENEFYRDFEIYLLSEINKLGIGPQGFGGNTTALAVNIEYAPTHIASLPVAVNMGCHVTRHAEIII